MVFFHGYLKDEESNLQPIIKYFPKWNLKVFINQEHDHIGIILEVDADTITVAEGNAFHDNISRIIKRRIDKHIRAYIRIPDGYSYEGYASQSGFDRGEQ